MRICRESNSEQVESDPRLEEFNQAYADIGTGAAYGYLPLGMAGFSSGFLVADVSALESWPGTPSCAARLISERRDRIEEFQDIYADIGTGAAYGYLPIGSAGYLSGTMQNEPEGSQIAIPLDGLFLALLDPSPGATATPRETPPPPPPAETIPVPAAINMPAGGSGFRTWFRQAITARMVR